MDNEMERRMELQLIPQRLLVFLLGSSILVLGFIHLANNPYSHLIGYVGFPLSRVLALMGLLSAIFAIPQFIHLLRRVRKLEDDLNIERKRKVEEWVYVGRGAGVICAGIIAGFWIYALCCVA